MHRPSSQPRAARAPHAATLLVLLVVAALAGLLQPPPAHATITDAYASAFDLTSALTAAPFSFSDAATDVSTFTRDAAETDGLSTCGSYPPIPDNTYSVWYSFTPSASGWLLLGTMNAATNYDTVIEVWQTALQPANSIACNDDAVAGNRRSELNFQVTAGTHYIIAIRRYGVSAMAAPTLAFDAAFSPTRELFVDQTNGNDANTGSQALPFRTLGRAEHMLPASGGTLTVLDPGSYNESVTLSVPTTLNTSGGAVSIAHLTLASTSIAKSGAIGASTVTVQPGALAQEGVQVAEAGATVSLADATFTETVTIDKNLTLQALHDGKPLIHPASGPAIQVSAGSVRVTGLNLQGDKSVLVSGGSGHVVTFNNLFGNNSGIAIDNQTASQVDATRNWWGDRGGPPGDGDNVSGDVLFRPWCDTAVPTCTSLVGAATQLRFTTSPTNTMAGTAFAAQPVIEAVDDQGVLDGSFAGAVTLAIQGGSGTPGATLGGTATITASSGIADFSGQGLNIDYAGQGYRLTASSGALTPGTSGAFAITADRLVVTASPANPTGAGTPLAISVAARDGFGHTDATYTSTVALAIQSNPTGAPLLGTTAKPAAAGVAAFGGAGEAAIAKIGTGYTLRASSGALATADSSAFDIASGTRSTLVFDTSPSASTTAGVAFATQPSVSVQDSFGNVDTSFVGAISLAIKSGSGTPGATLAGTTTVNAVNGVASFSGLNITTAGSGYQLVASIGGLPSAASTAFDITPAAASALAVAAAPANTMAGTAFATQPVIVAQDQFGNTDTSFGGAVTLAIQGGSGTPGAALAGTTTVSASSGVASFSGLSIDKIGAAYKLAASASGLTPASTPAFDITANGLFFTLQPVSTPAGQNLLVKVAAQDGAGTTDTGFNGQVTLTLKSVGRSGPSLLGTTTVSAISGVADFSAAGLNIQKAGVGYVLTASAAALAVGDSSAFDITAGAATKLVVISSPPNTPADAPFALAAEAQDSYGNLDTGFSGTIDLAIQANPGGGALGGTSAKAASGGQVSFGAAEGLNINHVGAGYVLRASSGALATGDTAAFNITANRLVFATSPGTSGVGYALRPAPVVQAVDSFGGVDTTFGAAVALTIKSGSGTPGASLRGTADRAASGGIASFNSVSIDRIGAGYQLSASTSGLADATSAAFEITRALTYVPWAIQPPLPDLVGSFKLSTNQVTPFEPVEVTVSITNTGDAPAGQFWVDFYINPAEPPTAANQPWDKRCGKSRCKYGIAWYVDATLAPGQSVTLTSTRASYAGRNTAWPGYFDTSRLNLYLYVDSWNQNISYGAVYERNEANNRFDLHLGTGGNAPPPAAATADAPLPPRPVRPAR